MRQILCHFSFYLLFVCAKPLLAQETKQDETAFASLTSTPLGLDSSLDLAVRMSGSSSLLWDALPLRQGIGALANANRIPWWFDRRVDPAQAVSLNASLRPLQQLLVDIKKESELDIGAIESVLYVGPRGKVAQIETAYWKNYREYFETQSTGERPSIQRRNLKWDEATTPQAILAEIETLWDIKLEGKDQIEHDLWHAVNLPPLTLPAQLALVLGGFDYSVKPPKTPGGAWEIIPIEEDSTVTVNYRASEAPAELIAKTRKEFPTLKDTKQGTTIVLTAPPIAHYFIQCQKRTKPSNTKNLNYTFEVTSHQGDALIEAMGAQLGMSVQWKGIDKKDLANKRVSLKVSNASLDQMLRQLSEAAGVTIKHEDGVLIVQP